MNNYINHIFGFHVVFYGTQTRLMNRVILFYFFKLPIWAN